MTYRITPLRMTVTFKVMYLLQTFEVWFFVQLCSSWQDFS